MKNEHIDDDDDDGEGDFDDMIPWWKMKAHSRHDRQERVAPCWKVGVTPVRWAEDPHTHLGAAWSTADEWPLLLQIHLGFLINLKGQREREEGKQIHEYFLLPPEKREESSAWSPLSMPIPKLEEKNMNMNISLPAVWIPTVFWRPYLPYFKKKRKGMALCSKNSACGKPPGLCSYQVRPHLHKRIPKQSSHLSFGGST